LGSGKKKQIIVLVDGEPPKALVAARRLLRLAAKQSRRPRSTLKKEGTPGRPLIWSRCGCPQFGMAGVQSGNGRKTDHFAA